MPEQMPGPSSSGQRRARPRPRYRRPGPAHAAGTGRPRNRDQPVRPRARRSDALSGPATTNRWPGAVRGRLPGAGGRRVHRLARRDQAGPNHRRRRRTGNERPVAGRHCGLTRLVTCDGPALQARTMPYVPTTAGDTDIDDLGVVYMHEHVFIRTEPLQWGWPGFGGWDTEAEVASARERLRGLAAAGVGTILDMTVPGLGRDPALVARAAEGTGLNIMFATGYYTYDNLPFPFQYRGPGKILDGDDRVLESLFERDLTVGIGDTGLRAAVLKVVTDEPGMTEDVERVALAVANVHAAHRRPDLHARARAEQARARPAAGPGLQRRGPGPGDDRPLERVDRPGLSRAGHRQRVLPGLGPVRAARWPCRSMPSSTPWPRCASAATRAGSCCRTTRPRSWTGSPRPRSTPSCPTGATPTFTAGCCPACASAASPKSRSSRC